MVGPLRRGQGPAGAGPRVEAGSGDVRPGRAHGSRQGLRQPAELPGGQPDRVAPLAMARCNAWRIHHDA